MPFPVNEDPPLDPPLLFRVQQGDLEIWSNLVEQYNLPLRKFIASLDRNIEDIEDILGETWRKAWQAKEQAKPNIKGWLFEIAKNTTIDLRRKKWVRRGNMSLDRKPEDGELFDGTWHTDPEDLEERVEVYMTLSKSWVNTCAQITDEQKEIYRLFSSLKTPDEIAKIMNLSKKAVENHICTVNKIFLAEYRKLKKGSQGDE